jgi:predicted metal-binding membrane protein
MAPAVAPVASLYARTIKSDRFFRLSLFSLGYLAVWALAGVPTYAVLRLVDHVGGSGTPMRYVAAGVLAAAGLYQLSPLKSRCLRHCRSPLAQLLHYGNMRGPLRELKVGLHHAAYCLGCCWALMALLIAFGMMNLWAMLALAALVLSEKVLPRGETIGRVVGALCLVLSVLVVASPAVGHALVPGMAPMNSVPMTHM